MTDYVIWIDSKNAHLFTFGEGGVHKMKIELRAPDHHTFNKKDHHGDPATDHFFHAVLDRVRDAEEIYLTGPSFAKLHFKSYLDSHAPEIAKAVVGIETCDHPTDNQVMATARKFFKKFNLYNRPLKPE